MEQFRGEVSCNFVVLDNIGTLVGHSKCTDIDGSYAFGWFWLKVRETGEIWMKDFYISDVNGAHGDIETNLLDSWSEENHVFPDKAKNYVSLWYEKRGRIWPNEKIMAFDQNKNGIPSKEELKFIINELEEEAGLDIDWNEYKIYITDSSDPNTESDDDHIINCYTLREYITGIGPDDNDEPVDIDKKREQYDNDAALRSGEEKYQRALANDPRMDRMYSHFVAEGKKRKKLVISESQRRRLIKRLMISECVDNIIKENIL